MNKDLRTPLIAGNWKMNKTPNEAAELVADIKKAVGQQTEVGVLVCPPFTALDRVSKLLEGSTINLGAQNMHAAANGAYTGEIAAGMLRELFCGYVILGHSERRTIFAETDAEVNAKVKTALSSSLKPVLCVGETLDQREADQTLEVVNTQLVEGLKDVAASSAESVVIAYEPVWAIGTGKVATPEQAQEVHAAIRAKLAEIWSQDIADKVRILYGGSMKPSNAAELLAQTDIDGGLIGGASLEAASFVGLVEAASAKVNA